MSREQLAWPDDMPTQCPPESAAPQEMTVFRFTKSSPPTPLDFQRPVDLPNNRPDAMNPCTDFALSVLTDETDIELMRKIVPGMAKRHVSRALIRREHGLFLNSPILEFGDPIESHFDWWVPISMDPLAIFSEPSL